MSEHCRASRMQDVIFPHPESPAAEPRRYAMFISYRHADNLEMGRKWATWLHETVENYEVPRTSSGNPTSVASRCPPRFTRFFAMKKSCQPMPICR